MVAALGCEERPSAPAQTTASSAEREAPAASVPSATSAPSASEAAPPSRALESAEPGSVTLDDPGAPPRQALRHRFERGARSRWAVTVQALTQVGDGPPETIELAVKVRAEVEALEGDRARIGLRITELSPLDEPAAQEAWSALADAEASLAVDVRGRVGQGPDLRKDVDLLTSQLWTSLREALTEAWLPYPEEAVGVGARWTARRDLARGGIRLRRSTRLHLRRRDERIEVGAELTEAPRPGAWADPELGGIVTLEALKGSGVGRRQWAGTTDGPFVVHARTEVATDLLVRGRLKMGSDAPAPPDRVVKTTQVVTLEASSHSGQGPRRR